MYFYAALRAQMFGQLILTSELSRNVTQKGSAGGQLRSRESFALLKFFTKLSFIFRNVYKLELGIPYAAVLIETGRTTNEGMRNLITQMGKRLGLERVVWMPTLEGPF